MPEGFFFTEVPDNVVELMKYDYPDDQQCLVCLKCIYKTNGNNILCLRLFEVMYNFGHTQ